ncbi:MAG: hypothetical protein KC493_03715 [Bacteriovoracaceae bacterium]|nr:hypothetical protein [Bacteriovoracaceae bacterium]
MKLILIALLFISSTAMASGNMEGGGNKENFEMGKKMMLEHMDMKIAGLQKAKSCIQAATNKEGLKACRSHMKESRSQMKLNRKKMKEMRKGMRKKKKKNSSDE